MKLKSPRLSFKFVLAAFAATLMLVGAQASDKYKVLHYFHDKPAATPEAALVADSAGNLYGTAAGVGPCDLGYGSIFRLTPGSGGDWIYRVIHRFDASDGFCPLGALILDPSGDLYGTAYRGGAYGGGVVFELSPSGAGWKEEVLHHFGNSSDLAGPQGAPILDAAGHLYGTTEAGGTNGYGGVFELKLSGNQWSESILHSFTGGPDGLYPYKANVVLDSTGNLYSTTCGGGKYGDGVVYELTPSSSGRWTETVLHSFSGGADGSCPFSGVIFDAGGNLYGTTVDGGPINCGTVFKLSPSTGAWKESIIHAFRSTDGCFPWSSLTADATGALNGTTMSGGPNYSGVAFKLTPSGGRWSYTLLHTFNYRNGAFPVGGVILDQKGILYGTTSHGGKGQSAGYGVIFDITP
jgi:uncharacterized repeat protein (TIGR03803 family)